MSEKNLIQKFGSLYTDKSINSWVRGGMWVATGIVVFIVGKQIFKKVFPSDSDKKAAVTEKNLDTVIKNGQPASFPDAQYDTWANTLESSMNRSIGDDYGKVVNIMTKMKNDTDVAKIIKAYGKRQLYVFGLPDGSPIDLFTTINKELGNELYMTSFRVSQINSDWKKKNITFTI